MMNRLIVPGAFALFLIGCSAKTEVPSNVVTDTTLKFDLGDGEAL